jgi:2'-5' RNA ligase
MDSHGPFTPNELYALVGYVPDPLGSFLDGLRHTLPGHKVSPAHLTFLPPRPFGIAPEAASAIVRDRVRSFAPFEVELTTVQCFPYTNVLYLALSDGSTEAKKLHDVLASEIGLSYTEECEYRPHITLSAPLDGSEIDEMQRLAASAWSEWAFSRRFLVRSAAFLRRSPAGVWERLWIEPLAASTAS